MRKRAVRPASRPLARSLFRPATFVAFLALVACAAAGYQFWLRESSLVAIEEVQVEGAGGPERKQIVAALTEAAAGMTTLHVREDELNAAVRGFPTVIGVDADPHFPHGLTISVRERAPVLIARSGGETVPVAGDGTVLAGVEVKAKLPVINVEALSPDGRLEGSALALAQVAGAAPEPLRRLITDLRADGEGLEVTLRGDIPVRFGGAEGAAEAWAAAATVLADPSIENVVHVDVRVPERPAVGGASLGTSEETTVVLDEEIAVAP